jgi:8-oxoguanine deaminase
VVFEGGVIVAVEPADDIARSLSVAGDVTRIDGRDHAVMPGAVNTHHHLYQSLTRGLKCVQDARLFDWLTALYQRWQYLSHETVRLAAQVSVAELLLSGCTTTSDHFYVFPRGTDVRMESVLEAVASLGIRAHVCRGSMNVGQSSGGLPPDVCTEDEPDILRDYDRVVQAYHDRDPLAMMRIDVAPCSPFNVSEELFRDTASYAREHGLLLHTHAAETQDEEDYCLKRFKKRPIPYLAECGWLGRDVYLAHCVKLDDADIDLIAETKTGVSHCPCSNMRLGSGVAPIARLLERGVNVGLGVDGSSSNDGGHMVGEARQALLLARTIGGPTALSTVDAFRLLTVGGAQVLNREKLGRVQPGCAADLAMFRRDAIELSGATAQDPLGALMLCRIGRADRVIVNGRTVVEDGHLTLLDERKLAADLNAVVARSFT